jgi:thiamine biosynthesis lipoprotein
MSPAEAASVTAFDSWNALGMLVQLVVTSPGHLGEARALLEADLRALDLACSRFRPDSELIAVGNAARSETATASASRGLTATVTSPAAPRAR